MKTYNYRKPYSKEEGVLVNNARKQAKNYVWAFHCMWSQCGNVYVRLMDNWFQPCFEILFTHFITWQKAWVYFRILSRAKISIYSLCDTHLIKPFGKKACQARNYLPEGKSRNAWFTEKRVSLLSFPTHVFVWSGEWSILKPLFGSSSFRMFDLFVITFKILI